MRIIFSERDAVQARYQTLEAASVEVANQRLQMQDQQRIIFEKERMVSRFSIANFIGLDIIPIQLASERLNITKERQELTTERSATRECPFASISSISDSQTCSTAFQELCIQSPAHRNLAALLGTAAATTGYDSMIYSPVQSEPFLQPRPDLSLESNVAGPLSSMELRSESKNAKSGTVRRVQRKLQAWNGTTQ